MTRIVILGGPKTGKTTLANALFEAHDWPHSVPDCDGCGMLRHTDDLIPLGWSEASQAASAWFDEPGPWIIEGVAAVRALRKWRDQHPGEPPPVDRVIYLTETFVELTAGQRALAKGVLTVSYEILDWLHEHGIVMEKLVDSRLIAPHLWSADRPGGPLCTRCGRWMAHDDGAPCPGVQDGTEPWVEHNAYMSPDQVQDQQEIEQAKAVITRAVRGRGKA